MAGLQAFLAFVETVKRGSFAAAARSLGLSASTVAKSVARLEADLGLRLFHRSTRQVVLTTEGEELYQRCSRIADEIEALHDEAAGARARPSGTLRLSAPVVLGRQRVVPALAELRRRHPQLGVELELADRQVDVLADRLDGALRVGPLADSALAARRVGEHHIVTVAAPAYLARRGTPGTPEELAPHDCLLFRSPSSGRTRPWAFAGGVTATLGDAATLAINDGEALVAAACAGMGLAQVPDYMVAEAIARGALVEVLADRRPPPLPISLVYPSARQPPPRLRAFIELLCGPMAPVVN
ncbi:LysR family transcriptional regulator [Azoarcus olearius]|uniref:Transcriptional regulator, LysR family,putative n=1 Tax=Azoarcus sp. (strain BH72) TaxID=418699 RepID=A1K8R2_AZOSB|nr:LysR family transcriptional regulator [Azoarcus olearius]CAL95217.1 transcriptional regulator, LysR family,putative [Azoarcus olearius]